MQYNKPKTASKLSLGKGNKLDEKILSTMDKIATIVGGTLGPGGCPVLIEDQREEAPMIITKDGVTVHRHLAFDDSIEQAILEAARSAAVRTADVAGDGTTTATILSEAIVRRMMAYCRDNPKFSPQKGVRALEKIFATKVEPLLQDLSVHPNFDTDEGKKLLNSVAKISANGDTELADAVMKCFELVGDDGNVTIEEQTGAPGYRVDRVEGYATNSGFQASCRQFYSVFLNDKGSQRISLKNPNVILYHGQLNNIENLAQVFSMITKYANDKESGVSENVVIVAHGFSEAFLIALASNWSLQSTLKVLPVVTPKTPVEQGQLYLLEDLAALTNTVIFNPVTRPINSGNVDIEDLGKLESVEMFKDMTNFIGHANSEVLLKRVDELKAQLANPSSKLEKALLEERVAQLVNGIAKLVVIGAGQSEIREKKDRAEDAICAVKGAITHGCLPGGGWGLLRVASELAKLNDPFLDGVLVQALQDPIDVLMNNAGLDEEEKVYVVQRIVDHLYSEKPLVYDALALHHVNPFESGILDSSPAVIESIRNSISIAALLGTLGGVIVFPRDRELDNKEADAALSFQRAVKEGEQIERHERELWND